MAYWLFKTEPDAYSLEDLKNAPQQSTFWEGIRNYQARNFMRDQMQVGDEVFIYHSSCKVPAVVGIAKVTKGAQTDPYQFDASSDYYDPKSTPENPRWIGVTVQYVEQLPSQVTLKAIKADDAICELALKKAGRLSIMPVNETEWLHIIAMSKR
ncbi:EVE domain-containing protein [Pseudoalteromonas luteoviolacea]|uniref:Thymocyte nuclear protein 1 n=1 Tax=Pseudoalteromonas luteoviolacea S4054 TaxID=1129367 RepID=A0A0F6A4U0_9GAMM|nr:EVE domain-containing protein [Pseudoalteromonas luteoviolacea]AOT06574.1 EVE domain-containing protein [Pseudoalteromonas luteoviolacea]AOT11491.1 EVE domain-containing protein [Pseudoalteromonas luteoviolacea]AOT16404.1 EVE domain-containing protein [Pseudoalteromonas luteoviolacea]KKE81103.1 thymocyte nuclear protein 1 [Pseudoalteromonas luteoviolacea S4054]KZN62489.1 thymocyte nuclear protein 1 [Pseudoalteromonas luteoviolacea S4047-1]